MSETLDFREISEFKKAINEKYSINVYFQSHKNIFYFDETEDGAQQFCKEYFSVKNLLPVFTDDGLSFTLERIELC